MCVPKPPVITALKRPGENHVGCFDVSAPRQNRHTITKLMEGKWHLAGESSGDEGFEAFWDHIFLWPPLTLAGSLVWPVLCCEPAGDAECLVGLLSELIDILVEVNITANIKCTNFESGTFQVVTEDCLCILGAIKIKVLSG
ncbi:hypothetical protein EK904_002270 [Melospiza melodia maxima]|nr:hypothetical protein EK904_002270 [Melospiza melodia maxima]